ncbi:MAG: CRP-like cAMP-activated global transcriptional regulator [Chlamydiae bacterium]|nr:CRP-like cAMP-activated global transcriptional regulator [Chlamydiota bacterium]
MKALNLIEKAFLLKKTAFFHELDLDLVLSIADKLDLNTFSPDTAIFSIGQETHHMYLIVEGKVKIEDEKRAVLAELRPGEFFGDEAIFTEKPQGYSAIAVTECVILSLSRSHLLTIISECPSVALNLLEAYTANIAFRKR